MDKIKVSIVVPIYKVEKYLRRCLDSLINQTFQDIEIICVNDGSPDNCLQIIKQYKDQYKEKKIVIIDKQNEGLFKARVSGTAVAKGEYVAYIDSDDYVKSNWIEDLYNTAIEQDADISVCGFCRMDADTEHIYSTEMIKNKNKIIDINKNPESLISVNPAAWNKLYKLKLVKDIDLDEVPPIFEDLILLQLASLNAKRIAFTNNATYFYMVRKDSMISTIKPEQIAPTQKAMRDVRKKYEMSPMGQKLIPVIDSMAFIHLGISLMFRLSNDKKIFNKYSKNIKNYLNKEFKTWRKTKYLNLSYTFMHKFENFKVAVMKKIYVLHMYKAFLIVYRFMINVLKIDIKW